MRCNRLTRKEREERDARLIKSLGEHFGFTPKQIGEMTIYQVMALMDDTEDENKTNTSSTSTKQTMSVAEYRRLVRGQI